MIIGDMSDRDPLLSHSVSGLSDDCSYDPETSWLSSWIAVNMDVQVRFDVSRFCNGDNSARDSLLPYSENGLGGNCSYDP